MSEDERWAIKVHALAVDDMHALKARCPETFADMMDALKTLMTHPNVFDVAKPLDCMRMYPDAKDYVRFKRKRGKWRVVFRFLSADGRHLKPSEALRPGEIYLQIVFVDERTQKTYTAVRYRVAAVAVA